MPLPVSVLDLVGLHPGEPAAAGIARSVDIAQHVEEWGYRRFWLAEHHSIEGLGLLGSSRAHRPRSRGHAHHPRGQRRGDAA